MPRRNLRTIFIAVTQVVAVSALALTVPIAGVEVSTAAAASAARPTIRVSAASVELGTPVKVYGESPALLQTVRLQVETAENGWRDLGSLSNLLGRSYAFTAPSWYGVHRLRVVASRTLLAPMSVSDVVTVRVRMPYAAKGNGGDWSWISHTNARWDPCSTISYRINPSGGYAGATADISAAFKKLGQVTGFRFSYAGTTTSAVRRGTHGYHPPGTDVVVDWQTATQDGDLAGRMAGIGGHWVQGSRRFDGYVVLDQDETLKRAMWRRVIAHELGHVIGLGHARSTLQVMHRGSSETSTRLGAGDLTGLRRLGASRGCLALPDLLRESAPESVSQR